MDEHKFRNVRDGKPLPSDQHFRVNANTPRPKAPFEVRPFRDPGSNTFGLVVIDQASRDALFWLRLQPDQYLRLIEQINEIADPDAVEHTNLAMNVVGAAMSFVLATGRVLALPADAYGEHGAMRGLSQDEAEVRLAAAVHALVEAHNATADEVKSTGGEVRGSSAAGAAIRCGEGKRTYGPDHDHDWPPS